MKQENYLTFNYLPDGYTTSNYIRTVEMIARDIDCEKFK